MAKSYEDFGDRTNPKVIETFRSLGNDGKEGLQSLVSLFASTHISQTPKPSRYDPKTGKAVEYQTRPHEDNRNHILISVTKEPRKSYDKKKDVFLDRRTEGEIPKAVIDYVLENGPVLAQTGRTKYVVSFYDDSNDDGDRLFLSFKRIKSELSFPNKKSKRKQ